jgi:hypothetical protein
MDDDATRPNRVQLWRHAVEHGELPATVEPERALAELAAHWQQRLAVALDAPLEQEPPGPVRLRRVLGAWLDLVRTAPRVHRLLESAARSKDAERSARLVRRQRQVLRAVLAEDLAALGVPDPGRSAADLLDEAAAVAEREQLAGRVLRREREQLLGPAAPARSRPSLLRRLHLVPA